MGGKTHELSVKDLVMELLALNSPEDRRSLLYERCAKNSSLQAEIEQLMAREDQLDEFIDNEIDQKGAIVCHHGINFPGPVPGIMIGPYTLLKRLGESSMGTVHLAQQKDSRQRQIAIKIIKPGIAARGVMARFETEREILAMMDHPHIACVFDGGITDRGQPYFGMDLVQGLPITNYADEQRMTTRDRLELFIKVCQAVHYAHQVGVIHRNLKPSKVIVTKVKGEAIPKVIDFGVARAIDQTLADLLVDKRKSSMIKTQLHMSPEQATTGKIDTRTDVYALGALLFELLAGIPPFDWESLKKVGPDGIRRVINEETPPRPSIAFTRQQSEVRSALADFRQSDSHNIRRTLKRELDWIVMKALEKDSSQRYASASAMAEDISRYIDNKPVKAVPASIVYRIRKMASRRN